MGTTLMGLLHEQAPDAIIFAGTEGLIQEWNAAAEAMFGHSRDEAVGKSLDLIIPEEFRKAHWAGFDRALAEGKTKYEGRALPTRSVRKDGSTFYVELSFAIVLDEAGTALGALAHARDISERWANDREQRRRLRELEAQAGQTSQQSPR
jgi:PAS domain S-box-containing protein